MRARLILGRGPGFLGKNEVAGGGLEPRTCRGRKKRQSGRFCLNRSGARKTRNAKTGGRMIEMCFGRKKMRNPRRMYGSA